MFRLDGFYRFNKRHRLEYSYYTLNSNGTNSLDEVDVGEDVVVNAKLESKLKGLTQITSSVLF